jgi:hypothetical protein
VFLLTSLAHVNIYIYQIMICSPSGMSHSPQCVLTHHQLHNDDLLELASPILTKKDTNLKNILLQCLRDFNITRVARAWGWY